MICFPLSRKHIRSDMCSPIQKKISLVICVPLPRKQFHWVARLQAKLNLRLQLEIKRPKLLGHVNSSYLLINRCWTGYHVLFNVEIGHSICLRMLNENRAGLCSFPQVLTLSIESWPTLFFVYYLFWTLMIWSLDHHVRPKVHVHLLFVGFRRILVKFGHTASDDRLICSSVHLFDYI